jgi:hypothetical protein
MTMGARRLAAEHEAGLGDLVDQFIRGTEREIGEAHLDNGARADHRRTERRRHDRRLRDRGVGHTLGAKLLSQALVLTEDTTAAQIFAHAPDGRISEPSPAGALRTPQPP